MSEQQNLDAVRNIYAAFGCGDLASILQSARASITNSSVSFSNGRPSKSPAM